MPRTRTLVLAGLALALLLAGLAGPLSSRSPDGLQRVAADHGLDTHARQHPLAASPLAGYTTPGVQEHRLSRGLAGTAGVMLTLTASGALFLVLRRRTSSPAPDAQAQE